jgi:SAM-dependent methyltransferase
MYLEGVTDLFHGESGIWNLQECTGCGLIYTSPQIPEDRVSEYYPDDYASYGAGGELSGSPAMQFLKSAAILPYTLRYGQPGYLPRPFGAGRLLEIGCGAGGYLKELSSLGWQCTGVDISAQAIANARMRNPNSKLIKGVIGDVGVGEKFDVIVMHHVLEHLYHPREVVATCFEMLHPGGKLAVSVPDMGSLEARFFGRRWKGLDIPRHVLHFKSAVLVRLLEETGFRIERIRPGMFASSLSESTIMCLPAELRRKMIHSSWEHILYRLLMPVAACSYLLGNRGTVEIVAVKN